MKAEEILNKFAKLHMLKWNVQLFKITHPRLYKTIICAINEALNIHDVSNCINNKTEITQPNNEVNRPTCYWCKKPILPNERARQYLGGRIIHVEKCWEEYEDFLDC